MNETTSALNVLAEPSEGWALEQWLYYLEHRHSQAIQLRLVNAAHVATVMNVLKWSIPVITVGGTNGKGSTVTALAAIYQAAGYRVGQFTSPHLFRFNERICINQQPITDEELCQLFARIETARAETSLTYFEMSLLAALLYFKEADLDVLILEVGMGGRLDATNIIDADLAIVTTVDLDHQDLLGADKEAIGAEKAGIFRKGHLCIYADFSPPSSLLRHAQSLETKMLCLGKDYQFHIADGQLHIQHPFQTDTLETAHNSDSHVPRLVRGIQFEHDQCSQSLPCSGSLDSADKPRDVEFQKTKCQQTLVLPLPILHPHAAVSAVIASLCLQTRLPVSEKDWTTAMQTMRILGRQYWVPGEISFLYDVAHNPQAATALAQCIEHKLATTEQLSQKTPATPSVIASWRRSNPVDLCDAAQGHWPHGKIHAVFSALKDKDVCGLIKPLSSIVEQWYPASLRGQRAASQEQLQKAFRDVLGEQPHCYEDPIQATQAAVAAAKPGDWIVVYGSFLLVGAVMTANGQL